MNPDIKAIYLTFCDKYPLERTQAFRFDSILQQKFNVIGPMDTIEIIIIKNKLEVCYTPWGCL